MQMFRMFGRDERIDDRFEQNIILAHIRKWNERTHEYLITYGCFVCGDTLTYILSLIFI